MWRRLWQSGRTFERTSRGWSPSWADGRDICSTPRKAPAGGILFGHGPVFRDFNFDQDRQAATTVIAMGLPTTLVPYEVARQVMLGSAELGRMDAAGNPAAWVATRARGWLDFWQEDIGREGFYPFDLLAAAYVVEPRLFDCAKAHAWVSQDSRLRNWFYDPNALLVGFERATPAEAIADGRWSIAPRSTRICAGGWWRDSPLLTLWLPDHSESPPWGVHALTTRSTTPVLIHFVAGANCRRPSPPRSSRRPNWADHRLPGQPLGGPGRMCRKQQPSSPGCQVSALKVKPRGLERAVVDHPGDPAQRRDLLGLDAGRLPCLLSGQAWNLMSRPLGIAAADLRLEQPALVRHEVEERVAQALEVGGPYSAKRWPIARPRR